MPHSTLYEQEVPKVYFSFDHEERSLYLPLFQEKVPMLRPERVREPLLRVSKASRRRRRRSPQESNIPSESFLSSSVVFVTYGFDFWDWRQ